MWHISYILVQLWTTWNFDGIYGFLKNSHHTLFHAKKLACRPPCSLATFQPRLPIPCSLQWPPNLPIKSGHPKLEWNTMAKINGIWVFPKIMAPQNGWFIDNGKPQEKWMIWGAHPYFWKHPYKHFGHFKYQKLASTWSTLGLSGGFVCSKALEDSQPFAVRTWRRCEVALTHRLLQEVRDCLLVQHGPTWSNFLSS